MNTRKIAISLDKTANDVRMLTKDFNSVQKDTLLETVGSEQVLYDFYKKNDMPLTASMVKSYFEGKATDSFNSEYAMKTVLQEINNSQFKRTTIFMTEKHLVRGMRKKQSLNEMYHQDIREGINWLESERYLDFYKKLSKKVKGGDYEGVVADTQTVLDLDYNDFCETVVNKAGFIMGAIGPEKIEQTYNELIKNARKIKMAAKYLTNDYLLNLDPTEFIKSSYFLKNFNDEKYNKLINVTKSIVGENVQIVNVDFDHEKNVSYGSDEIKTGSSNVSIPYMSNLSKRMQSVGLQENFNDIVALLEFVCYNEAIR